MPTSQTNDSSRNYESEELNKIVAKLKSTSDSKRRYEYVLWLAKGLPLLPAEFQKEENKVKGCISQVFVLGELYDGKIKWQGFSDALITKGLLALLIKGLDLLTPEEVLAIDEGFIKETGLSHSLTPSRANGFQNILLKMKEQAKGFSLISKNSNH